MTYNHHDGTELEAGVSQDCDRYGEAYLVEILAVDGDWRPEAVERFVARLDPDEIRALEQEILEQALRDTATARHDAMYE